MTWNACSKNTVRSHTSFAQWSLKMSPSYFDKIRFSCHTLQILYLQELHCLTVSTHPNKQGSHFSQPPDQPLLGAQLTHSTSLSFVPFCKLVRNFSAIVHRCNWCEHPDQTNVLPITRFAVCTNNQWAAVKCVPKLIHGLTLLIDTNRAWNFGQNRESSSLFWYDGSGWEYMRS